MLLKDFAPHAALHEFVQCYRIVHFDFCPGTQMPGKAYPPKPEHCLHFVLRDPLSIAKNGTVSTLSSMFVSGQQSTLTHKYSGRDFLDLQIVFQPGAIFRLTGTPAHLLYNCYVPATDIFPSFIAETMETLREAKSYAALVAELEHFVRKLCTRSIIHRHPIERAGKRLIEAHGNLSIEQLAEESCLSIKQFKRSFYERVGLNPKTYARIVRFNRAYNMKNKHPEVDWLSVSLFCGYSDYQHLAKSYKDFTGQTPPELHKLENLSPENVLGIAKDVYNHRFQMND